MSLLSMRPDGALNRPSLNSSARAGAGVTGAVAQEATKRESNKTQKILIPRFRARLARRTTPATTKKNSFYAQKERKRQRVAPGRAISTVCPEKKCPATGSLPIFRPVGALAEAV